MEKKEKSYMLFHNNYRDYFEMLDSDQTKVLMISLFDFMDDNDFILESEDKLLLMIFKMLTDNIKIGMKKQLTSSINGKKGGRPKKEKEEKPKKEKKPTIKKDSYGEFKTVKLTKEQEEKLVNLYGSLFKDAIVLLDSYKESKGKTYKNDYAVLLENNWVYKQVKENNKKKKENFDLRYSDIDCSDF